VLPGHRREGIGGGLIKAAETWALAQGCSEMGSDADFSNKVSRRAHAALGYREVACLTLFARKLSG
jgi:aminoglycoside 6'-N-acetyltransferase I